MLTFEDANDQIVREKFHESPIQQGQALAFWVKVPKKKF